MASEVDLCNRALAAIGTRSTISSIQPSDNSNEANNCALLYYPIRDALLRAVHWDFARAQINLSQLKSSNDTNSTCPVPWAYEYAYPSDCMKMRFMLPFMQTNSNGGVPFTTAPSLPVQGVGAFNRPIRFLVATDKNTQNQDSTVLLTNQPNAIGVYTKQITNPDLFDSQFQEALVAAFAARLVPALALDLNLMKGQIAIAKDAIAEARVTNGNEGPMFQDSTPDWILVRGGYDPTLAGYFYLGWEQFSFPSGF